MFLRYSVQDIVLPILFLPRLSPLTPPVCNFSPSMNSGSGRSLPSPPPYAARHTIINVGSTNQPGPKPTSPPADPLEGIRTRSSLNIVFSPPPSLGAGVGAGSKRVPSPTYTLQSHFDKQSKSTAVSPPLIRSPGSHQEVLQIYRPEPQKTSTQSPLQPIAPPTTDLNAGKCL
ncbi:unnamed protein product [Dibothriocephalus latus]|uniref:Uncharacterized protein n=1 Tax=Dibothriocephalus latus TaxID=60516 RepID=A0A3P7LTA4_DIBLA|nr:unnamed protein product [Dibothriocephalus latus]